MTDVRNENLDDEDFDTILSSDIDFNGAISFEKPFLIRGRVTGQIHARDLLVVDENAVVDASIEAPRLIIRGTVTGNVVCSEKVEITAGGKLVGDVAAPEVFMETGCVFNGFCTMTKKTESV